MLSNLNNVIHSCVAYLFMQIVNENSYTVYYVASNIFRLSSFRETAPLTFNPADEVVSLSQRLIVCYLPDIAL